MQQSRAFLLRCWVEGTLAATETQTWRFSMEEVGEMQSRHGFATLELLLTFLHNEFASDQDESDQEELR